MNQALRYGTLGLLLGSGVVASEPERLVVEYSGTVATVAPEYSLALLAGDPFTGTYTIDFNPDADFNPDPDIWHVIGTGHTTLQAGPELIEFGTDEFYLSAYNDFFGHNDHIRFSAIGDHPQPKYNDVFVTLIDYSMNGIADGNRPAIEEYNSFPVGVMPDSLQVREYGSGVQYIITGRVESISVTIVASTMCVADLNRDGILDLGDIRVFVDHFLAEDVRAHMNADGILDIGDIAEFVSRFLEGC